MVLVGSCGAWGLGTWFGGVALWGWVFYGLAVCYCALRVCFTVGGMFSCSWLLLVVWVVYVYWIGVFSWLVWCLVTSGVCCLWWTCGLRLCFRGG